MPQPVYETHSIEGRSLPVIFHADTVKQTLSSIPNWHENIELLCFIGGEGCIRIDSEVYDVRAGDIAVIGPEMLHSVTSDGEVRYHCLIIDNSFMLENGINARELDFTRVIKDAALYESFIRLASELSSLQRSTDKFAVAHARYSVLGIIISLCRTYSSKRSEEKISDKSNSTDAIREIIHYLRAHLCGVTLDEIADHVGMSKYYMSREFKRVTGTTIFEYLNIRRCKCAKNMLLSGAKVTEAAASCGFDNLSYFSRTFKRYMGALPSEIHKSK